MEGTQLIGIIAGVFTGISLLPQLIKIIKEKKAGDISSVMLLVLMTGLALWIWYGARKEDLPILITNSFSFLINAAVLFFKFRYRNQSNG